MDGEDSSVEVQRLRRADGPELLAANAASERYHAPWVAPCKDQAAFNRWYDSTVTGANVALIGRNRATGHIVGVVTVSEIVLGVFRSAYLGFYGMADSAGTGKMRQTLSQALRYSFDELDLHRLEANIQPANLRSIRLVSRLGFSREGLSPSYLFLDGAWRDHERWTVLRAQTV